MEQAVVFGQYNHLLGVENIVDAKDRNHPKTAMILLTPGMLHNVGPFRMYVDIARELQNQGVSSLRFDLSGIGESLGVGVAGKSIDRAAIETKQAMDYLSEKHNIQQFILFGLCSGADDSIQTALQDDRVIGVIALDGIGYETTKFRLNNLKLSIQKLMNFQKVAEKVKSIFKNDLPPTSLATGGDVREFPDDPEQAATEFQQLVNKGTQLHFIYTGGSGYYNYKDQFYDMLPYFNQKNKVSIDYFPHMDHVVLLCEDRLELVKHVTDTTLGMLESKAKIMLLDT